MVDDRPANLVALEATLAPLGHRIVSATSGREALKALLTEEFALILLDVQMPDLDGFETAALIRAHPRTAQTPIIFVTAIHRDLPHVFKGYAQGCADYLQKPFDPTILRSKVAVFVDLYLREKRLEEQTEELRTRERDALRRDSERRVRWLVDAMPLALCALRPDGTVYYYNRAWTDYTGVALEDALNDDAPENALEGERDDATKKTPATQARMTLARLVHSDDLARLAPAWTEAFAQGEPFEAQGRLRRAADGSFRWHVGRAIPERDATGTITGWIITAADVERQKRAEEEYAQVVVRERQAREEAEAANRAKDEFLATLSHELRTPLSAMVGWTRMLRTGNLTPEKSQKALETIERNAKAQADLIEDILDVSRIITGKLRLEIHAMDPGAIARAAMDAVRPAAEAKGILLETLIAPPASASSAPFRGDPSRLQQVIWNLLSNAIKFTPSGGHVTLALEWVPAPASGDVAETSDPGGAGDPAGIRVTVRDDGRGIDPRFTAFIFDRFRQIDSTSQRVHGGLGLGLAIVRHLVELHGGTIAVHSAGEDQGATFTLVLPSARPPGDGAVAAVDNNPAGAKAAGDRPAGGDNPPAPPQTTPAPIPGADPDVDLAGVHVLLVDDEPDARELVAEVLEQYGATVVAAASAEEALGAIRARRPTVLLSDIGLPGEDGYSLIRRVRALPAAAGGDTPAAALTAYARSEDARMALASGFLRHAVKPIDPAALAALVRDLADAAKATPHDDDAVAVTTRSR
jgi:signal transduction histidine kinase